MKNYKQHFTTIVLCCYALFLFFLLRTGTIRKFINPKLSFLSVIALLIIATMIFCNLTKSIRGNVHSHAGTCHHHEPEKVTLSNYLLFLPIILSLVIAPGTLGYQSDNNTNIANTAEATTTTINKNGVIIVRYNNQNQYANPANTNNLPNSNTGGVDQNSGAAQDMAARFVPAGYVEYTQLDIGDTIFDTQKATIQKLTQAKVFIRGKVLKFANLKKNELVLYRVVITCCAADGLPLGILVQLPQDENFTPDEWIGVEGSILLQPFNDKLKNIDPVVAMVTPKKIFPVVSATKAYQIQPPPDEYLYP